jgi:hypothetical protein
VSVKKALLVASRQPSGLDGARGQEAVDLAVSVEAADGAIESLEEGAESLAISAREPGDRIVAVSSRGHARCITYRSSRDLAAVFEEGFAATTFAEPMMQVTQHKRSSVVRSCVVVLVGVVGLYAAGHGHAATMMAEPQETWSNGTGLNGFRSREDLLATLNAQYAGYFATCMAQSGGLPTYNCRQMILTVVRADPQSPERVNGDYTQFLADGHWQIQGSNSGAPYSSTESVSGFEWLRRSLVCPEMHGFSGKSTVIGPNETRTVCEKTASPPLQCDTCVIGKPAGTGAPGTVGNPLTVAGSNKIDRHTDYASPRGRLKLVREFRGQLAGWRFPGSSVLADLFSPSATGHSVSQIFLGNTFSSTPGQASPFEYALEFPLIRSTEHGEVYRLNGDGTATIYPAKADGSFAIGIDGDRLMPVAPTGADGTAWRWYRANNVVEELGADGRPRRAYWPSGESLTYTYANGRLETITDHLGRRLTPVYGQSNRVDAYQLPDGTSIRYDYTDNLLTRATYADGSAKGFAYSEPSYFSGVGPVAPLTGQFDENGKRVATYRYDAFGRAVSTEGADGVNRYVVSDSGSVAVVTPPVGGDIQYSLGVQNGSIVVMRRDIVAGAGSSASNTTYTYDSVGNITRVLGYTGIASCHGYDLGGFKLEAQHQQCG